MTNQELPRPVVSQEEAEAAQLNRFEQAIEDSKQKLELAELGDTGAIDEEGRHIPGVDVEGERLAIAANSVLAKNEHTSSSPWTAQRVRDSIQKNPTMGGVLAKRLAEYEEANGPFEAAAEQQSETPEGMFGAEEMRAVLMHSTETEARDGLEEAKAASLATLEAGPNNTGVGNVDFAKTQFNANIYASKVAELDRDSMDEAEYDQVLDELLAEGELWKRIATGGDITPTEYAFVQRRALELRKEASAKTVAAEQRSVERSKTDEQRQQELLDQIPENEKDREAFVEAMFKDYDPGNTELFKAYITKEIRDWAAKVPDGASYPDTVRTMLGSGDGPKLRFLGTVMATHDRKPVAVKDLGQLKFTDVCRIYLGMDVNKVVPGYHTKFR